MLYACRKGRLEVVELLLSRGADPTTCENEGLTPLMYASIEGHVDVVWRLVRNKAVRATIDTQNRSGRMALWCVCFLYKQDGGIEGPGRGGGQSHGG